MKQYMTVLVGKLVGTHCLKRKNLYERLIRFPN